MSQTARRPLTLHVSALSEAEYSSFTSSLGELTSPTPGSNWEDVTLGVREARAWIRGRYGVGVDGATIDQILKNFSPELAPSDILTGGQFFAVLRLVCHARSGAPVDESLVFVQANPEPGTPKDIASRHSSTSKSAPPPPPRHSIDTPPSSATTPTLPPRTAPPVPSPNPFTRSLSTPGPKRPQPDSQPRPNTESDKHVSDSPVSSNPFRTQPHQPPWPKPRPTDPSVSSASSSSSSPSTRQYALAYATPPLPPRKSSALLPPPRHASLTPASVQKSHGYSSPSMPITSSKSYSLASPALLPPPPKPPRPPTATSPLIKQSLQAAKGAQSVKEIMDGLGKERRLEVIKKSGGGGVSGGQGGRSSSGSRSGEGTPHRSVSPPHSLYDVAAARIGRAASPSSYSNSSDKYSVQDADTSPPGLHLPQLTHTIASKKLTPQLPFAHVITPNTPSSPSPSPSSSSFPAVSPDNSPTHNGFSTGSGPAIARRSKSLHHPSPSSTLSAPASPSPSYNPPLPPPRRRRPDSVQVTSGSPTANSAHNGSVHIRRSSASAFPTLPHSSAQHASTSTTSDSSVLDTLHRTIATLRPGPGFESARVKAEGRVWPSGYVKGLAKGKGGRGGEGGRLVRDGGGADGDDEGDGGFGQDQEWDAGMDDEQEHGGRGRSGGMERDDLKMLVKPGEGWTVLT